MADIYPESRVEEILAATIDGTEYTEYPQSRIEQLLIELKAVIEAGGGGGGTTNYNLLINKPEIAGVELSGNKSLSDLGITQEIKKVMDMLAGQFDPTETYEEGKIVVYNKTLYVFTTDHAAGEFNPLEVEQTDVDRLLAGVYNAIPTDLSDLDGDSTHRTVTDTEKSEWNGKQDALTFDNTPTASSTNPVTSDGIQKAITATAKTASGNPIVIQDAANVSAESLKLTVLPIQSLHGYDHPWSGGAGKNQLPMTVASVKAANTAGTWNGNVYSVSGGTIEILTDESGVNVHGFKVSGTFSSTSIFIISTDLNTTALAGYLFNGYNGYTPYTDGITIRVIEGNSTSLLQSLSDDSAITDNGTGKRLAIRVGSGYTVPANRIFYPMIRLATVSDATFEPWSNECPISGRTAVNVQNFATVIKSTSDFEAGSYFADGGKNDTAENLRIRVRSNSIFMLPAGSYVINCTTTKSKTVQMAWNLWANGTYGTNTRTYNSGWVTLGEITLEEDSYFSIAFRYSDDSEISLSDLTISMLGTAADITIALGTTVYGGTLDVKTGRLTIDGVKVSFDGTETWNTSPSISTRYYAPLPDGAKVSDAIIASSHYEIGDGVYANIGAVLSAAFNTIYTSLDDWKAYLAEQATANTPVSIVYKLSTPTTVQLTGADLALLMGYNRVTSDSGDMELSYQPDNNTGEIKSWTEQKINTASEALDTSKVDNSVVGTVENGTTASREYAVGKHFIRNEKFCTVIAAIANGATFTLNTNYVESDISGWLQAKTVTVSAGNNISVNSNTNVCCVNGVVCGSVRLNMTGTLTTGQVICTLSEAPKATVYAIAMGATTSDAMPVIIGYDGKVYLFGTFVPSQSESLIIPISYSTVI